MCFAFLWDVGGYHPITAYMLYLILDTGCPRCGLIRVDNVNRLLLELGHMIK